MLNNIYIHTYIEVFLSTGVNFRIIGGMSFWEKMKKATIVDFETRGHRVVPVQRAQYIGCLT